MFDEHRERVLNVVFAAYRAVSKFWCMTCFLVRRHISSEDTCRVFYDSVKM